MSKKQKKSIELKVAPPVKGKGADGKALLSLKGELTISNAPELKEFLQQGLREHPGFHVSIDNPDSIDLTCIQLLHAFLNEARTMNKEVSLEANLTNEQTLLLTRSGLVPSEL